MLRMILRDLGLISVLCLGERVLERLFLPGLHRAPGRVAAIDPSRADDISALLAEALALFALVWVFAAALYAISYLSRRPLKPYATMLVTAVLLVLVFVGSAAEYATMPAARAQ